MLIRALQVCERKGMLFYELLSKLRRIAREFGVEAAWTELALQSAIHDEQIAWEEEQSRQEHGMQ